MKKMAKKGVSEVVSIVLIIMITVAAIAILWAIVIPMVKDGFESGTLCFNAQSDVTLLTDNGYTCIDTTTDPNNPTIYVQVKKGTNSEVELVGLQAIVSVGGETVTENIENVELGSNEEKTFEISSADFVGATSVAIAPILQKGNTEEICSASQETVLEECAFA